MNTELINSLPLQISEVKRGLVISLIVLVVYLIMLLIGDKFQKTNFVQKTANILVAFAVWTELVFGNIYELFGNNGLTYLLIVGAIITLINSIGISHQNDDKEK